MNTTPHARPRALQVLLLALALLLSACGSDDTSASDDASAPNDEVGAADPLTVYSGRSESLVGPLMEQFTDDTGIEVDVRYGDSAELALLIQQEGDRSPADVFYSQSPGATGFLAGENRLAELDASLLDAVDSAFRNAAGHWVGISGRQRVMVYNTDLVDPADLPATVGEVASGELAGLVAVAPENGSFQDFITAMRILGSDEDAAAFLQGLADNGAPTYEGNSGIVEAVSRGEVSYGLVNHYYGYQFLAEDPSLPIANHLFDGDDIGALLVSTSASILDTSDDTTTATAFIEYLLSEAGQTYFAEQSFEYPLATGVDASPAIPPLDTISAPPFDIDTLGGGLERTLELIRESGLAS